MAKKRKSPARDARPKAKPFDAEEQLKRVLTGARCILWHALVEECGAEKPRWDIHVFNEEAAERLHPLKRQSGQSYSKVWQEWTIPEDRLRIDQTSSQALRSGQSGYTQEFRSLREDGEIRWLHEDVSISPLESGRWLAVGVCTDITELKTAEAAMRVSEERYRAIVEDQVDLIVRFLPDSTLTYVNSVYARYFNNDPRELIGKPFLPFIPEPDRSAVKSDIDTISIDNAVVVTEHRVTTPSGAIRWHQWTNRGLFDRTDQLVEIQAVGRDITERKLAELRQKAISDGLRTVVGIADELLSCGDLDTLYRRTIELLREKLGVERCALFLRDGRRMTGTYGTSRQGTTTNEYKHSFVAREAWIQKVDALRHREHRLMVTTGSYHDWNGRDVDEFGQGDVAIIPIIAESEFMGVLCCDNAISGQPLDDIRLELIAVLASLLGPLMERRRSENRQREISAGLRQVVAIADELISCAELDAVYRRAVELAREKLGLERCSLFIRRGELMAGTYGTNCRRQTTDERAHVIPRGRDWLDSLHAMRQHERRMIVLDEPYTEWVDGRETKFGKGWVAITPILTSTEFLGLFCNDSALTHAALDETQQEIVSVFTSLLGAIIERKQIEDRQRAVSAGMHAVVSIADELITCPDIATLCRRAVELARERLGVERCAIFLREGEDLTGTYGTDRQGRTTHERGNRFVANERWLTQFNDLKDKNKWTVIVEDPYREWKDGRSVPFGSGWIGLTPIHSAKEFVGVFSNDTAISGRPVDGTTQEILAVYCSVLGAVIERISAAEELKAANVSLTQEIAERKRAEADLRQLAMVVEQEAEAVIIADTDATIQYVNPAFEQMTGYKRGEVLGKTPRILKSGKQEADFYNRMWETLRSGNVWMDRLTNRRKDGTLYEVEATISPIRDDAGRLINFVSTSRDVTREVELEQQFRRAQRMEAIGRLAGGIAHDFNNLLTSILGYSRLIQEEIEPDHPARADLEEIIRAGGRAVNLTKQLLAFSRKQAITTKVVDLNHIVMDMDNLLRRTIGEDVELLTVLAPQHVTVKADAGLIEQVILNLAVNARDAMPEGGTLTIQTALVDLGDEYCQKRVEARPGRYVQLIAKDNGIGMTDEVRERCFEPFFTSKAVGKGTGLGLSIVYGIVTQFEGFIDIATAPSAGTSFQIYMPHAGLPPAAETQTGDRLLPRGDETILVVEDEDTVRRLTARVLTGLGYKVLHASHGEEALRVVENFDGRINLVLTDVVMPHVGGRELVARLTQMRKDFKVLYMSGFTNDAFVKGEQDGRDLPLILKPFTQEALARKVREVLDSPQAPGPY